MKNETSGFAKSAKHELKESFSEGLKEAKKELKETGREVKELFTTALTLGGAFSFEEGIRGAVKMRGKLSDLAFMVSEGEKKQVSWNEIHEAIAPIAEETTRSVDELAGAYEKMYSATGNRDVSEGSLKAIGTIANASGKSVESLAGIAGALNEKFKISAKQMPEALAMVVELASKGGVEFEELQNVIETTGASALSAGLSGEGGLKKMLAVANIGGDALKNMGKGVRQVSTLFDQMVSPEFKKKLDGLHLNVKTMNKDKTARDATAVLEDILVKAKGKREQLAKIFTGEQLKLVVALGHDFAETYEKTGGNVEAARKSFEKSLAAAGESTTNYAEIEKRASERVEQDPAAALRRAMNKIEEAFMKPKMIEAIDKIAAKLPELADWIAKGVEFATDHPLEAGAALVGGKVAAGVLPGMIGSGAVGLGKSAIKALTGGGAAAAEGATVGEVAAGGAATAGGTSGLAALAAALGPIGAAVGAAGGVAAAGYQGYRLFKENQQEGGILGSLKEAFAGKTSNPVSGDDYVKRFGAKPDVISGASAPVPKQIAEATDGVKKHGDEAGKTAATLGRLNHEANRLTAYFATLGGGGVSRGPVGLGAPGSGSRPRPPNS